MMANTSEVKLGICHGCKMKFDECFDRKYRDICLHAVLDYIKEVESDSSLDITEFGFRKAYHNAYIAQVRVDLMKDKGKYELNPMLHIPPCMTQSSLDDVVQMAAGKGAHIIYYLEQNKLWNVEETLKHEAFTCDFLESTERARKKAKAEENRF